MLGTSVPITIEASYGPVAQELSFAVSFIKTEAPRPPTEEELEPEEPEEKEVVKEKVSGAEVTGWDGWKTLLERLNLKLPPPNPDPNYVPTPPIPSLDVMSSEGNTRIKFSKDVFEYPDLKSIKVPRAPRGPRPVPGPPRELQSETLSNSVSLKVEDADFETVNLIEVFVDYDQGKLEDPGFDP